MRNTLLARDTPARLDLRLLQHRGVAVAAETFWLFCRAWQKTLHLPLVLALVLGLPAVTLWLLGQIFASIHQIPGTSAIQSLGFFAPGMLMIAALFGSSFAGIGLLADQDSGFLERLMAAPIHRSAILLGKALADGSRTLLQALIILGLLMALNSPIHLSWLSLAALLVLIVIFSLAFAGLSYLIALSTKSTEALMLLEMLLFLLLLLGSNALLPESFLPHWMQIASLINPLSHTVTLARQLLDGSTSFQAYTTVIGFLALGVVLSMGGTAIRINHIS